MPQFDNWGCEFLDLENPVEILPVKYLELPISFIEQTVDIKYLQNLNTNKLNLLREDVKKNGVLQPGTLVYDTTKIKLQDGNHRFVVSQQLGLKTYKVYLKESEGKINTYGLQYKNVLEDLLKGKL